ncbi:MAG: ABC transporter substrate-binding protein [Candidatus Omnitrophota bacterium]
MGCVPCLVLLLCTLFFFPVPSQAGQYKIVSLAPNVTEILFKLGLGENVIGADDFSDFPEEAKDIEKLGAFNNPNIERMILLRPDYIFISASFDSEKKRFLESLGIKVVRVSPMSFDELKKDIGMLGDIFNRGEEAGSILEDIDKRLRSLPINADGNRPKIFIALSMDPLITVSSFVGDLIDLAGGENIADDMKKDSGIFSIEALIDRDPDIIIASGFIEDLNLPRSISAIKNNRVYKDLPADILLRPGPRSIDAIEILNKVFYEN